MVSPKAHPGRKADSTTHPITMLAIDPGEVHCGFAYFRGNECIEAGEWDPPTLLARVEHDVTHDVVDEVVIEEFELYPWKSQEQGFSQLRTVRVIGALEYVCARFGRPTLVVVFQKAIIKKPTVGQNTARKYKWVSRGHGGHAKDAETHGLYRVQKGRS